MKGYKPIKGFENLYLINIEGDVWNIKRKKHIKNFINIGGYRVVYLYPQNGIDKRKNPCVHKLIAEAFIPNTLNRTVVNHRDGNKQNNSLDNLEWVTKSEDIKHAHRMGLKNAKKGTGNYLAKLDDDKVNYIRSKKGIIPTRKLAKQFGVAQSTLVAAQSGKTWTHI